MILRKCKVLFGLCQCKGCFKMALYNVTSADKTITVSLCQVHTTEILLDPFWRF